MSNDIYEDLTDEEKALLKREMKHRIEQQKSREKVQKYGPAMVIAGGLSATIVSVLINLAIPMPYGLDAGFNQQLLVITVAPGLLVVLSGISLWLWRQYKRPDTKNIKGGSSKNKRG